MGYVLLCLSIACIALISFWLERRSCRSEISKEKADTITKLNRQINRTMCDDTEDSRVRRVVESINRHAPDARKVLTGQDLLNVCARH